MFLNKNKYYLLALAALLLVGACSPFQKVYKSDDVAAKYRFADSLYQVGKYRKALKLMEEIVPAYRGKPQAERLMFFYADTYFQLGDFYLSGYQFERFVRSYPNSDRVQEAAYKGAKSYYELSPRYSLDQEDTYTALEKLQGFIDQFPDSDYLQEANGLVDELNTKLEYKAIRIAKSYYHREDYKSAIEAYDNFATDYPGSEYRAEAFYMRMESEYKLAINSFETLVPERLRAAKDYYNSFIKYFADSEFREAADEINQDIEARLEAFNTETKS